MSYFLSNSPRKIGETISLTGEEARHILLSRRIRAGEIIEIQDPAWHRFESEVIEISKGSILVQVLREIETPKESDLKITIFQAIIKEQPLDFIIQKATELGVERLTLFNSKNSVDRFKDIEKKLVRWRKVGVEAAKQSGRIKSIEIEYLDDANEMINKIKNLEQVFLLEPSAKETFRSTWKLSSQVEQADEIGILVGPEGGFTESEVEEFTKIKNIGLVNMGPRILRADTAAITSAAVIQSLWGKNM